MLTKSNNMKLSYLTVFLILSFNIFSTTPRFQYCVAYCTTEDTLFDASRKPLLTDGIISMHCSNYIYELRNGDCPPQSNQGINSSRSPTKCYRLKNYNGQIVQGDGSHSYIDGRGMEWNYYNVTRTGETDNPKALISYSKKNGEYCLEIPLFKYKIVLFGAENHSVKPGYYERMQFNGNKFIIETIRESSTNEPSNPVESRIVYDYRYLFEEYRNNLIVTNPNPFDREIKVMLTREVLDSNSNLKLVLKDIIGNKVAVQNVEGPYTSINTVLVNSGKYILFLFKNEEILEYKQVYK